MSYVRRQRLSWARIKLSKYVIYTKLSPETYQSWFCSSYFKELVVSLLQFKNSKEFSESLFVLLFNFQGASRYRFSRQLCYYIRSKTLCQYFFQTFFKFFEVFFKVVPKLSAFRSSSALGFVSHLIGLLSIHYCLPFVNTFFQSFSSFFWPSTFLLS